MKTARYTPFFLALFLVLAIGLLAGCGAMGLAPAKTFEDKAYVTVSSIDTLQKVGASLVRLKTINANDGQAILDAADRAQRALVVIRGVAKTDPTGATNRLAELDAALATLQGYLSDSAAGSKNLPLVMPAILSPMK